MNRYEFLSKGTALAVVAGMAASGCTKTPHEKNMESAAKDSQVHEMVDFFGRLAFRHRSEGKVTKDPRVAGGIATSFSMRRGSENLTNTDTVSVFTLHNNPDETYRVDITTKSCSKTRPCVSFNRNLFQETPGHGNWKMLVDEAPVMLGNPAVRRKEIGRLQSSAMSIVETEALTRLG